MDICINDITILYIMVNNSPKQVEVGVEFTHEDSLTTATFIFPYECNFCTMIDMVIRL